jgi:hypothetical protein
MGIAPIMSPEFLRRALRVPADRNPDAATAQTIAIMCGHIHTSATDSLMSYTAMMAINDYLNEQMEPFEDASTVAKALWWYAKTRLRFIHHSRLIKDWFGELDQLQLLIEPSVLLRMPDNRWPMVGDCAIYSMLICAMLTTCGIPWRLVTAACDPKQPMIFTHVFPRSQTPAGGWITLDASHGDYPGWQVPDEHMLRIQAWDENGQPVVEN